MFLNLYSEFSYKMQNYIPIARFTYQHEYSVLKHLLEEAAIPFFFKNETMVSITPFYSNALGGIELLVHPDAKEEAIAIIEKLDTERGDLRVV